MFLWSSLHCIVAQVFVEKKEVLAIRDKCTDTYLKENTIFLHIYLEIK